MELLPGDRLGKYEIVGRLAAGGMAEVYLAKILGHGGFAKPVALKRMLPSLATEPGFLDMFMGEAAVAAQLSHQHIVQIFDFAEERGELYLAMEYVHGVNLKTLLANALERVAQVRDSSLRIPPMLAANICRCVARALSYAWNVPDENGMPSHLIHRDVSPHNVLLSYQGDIKLADFGIAKRAERNTMAGVLKGKLLYMAPEQLMCQSLDARTDIYALGIVLYETAMGLNKPLFDSGGEDALRYAIQGRQVVPPNRMDPNFPAGLSAVIMKALEREPQARFQTTDEFAEALGECIHRESTGPAEQDLTAFMRRLYGEPPPIRGLASTASERRQVTRTANRVPPSVFRSPDPAAQYLEKGQIAPTLCLDPSPSKAGNTLFSQAEDTQYPDETDQQASWRPLQLVPTDQPTGGRKWKVKVAIAMPLVALVAAVFWWHPWTKTIDGAGGSEQTRVSPTGPAMVTADVSSTPALMKPDASLGLQPADHLPDSGLNPAKSTEPASVGTAVLVKADEPAVAVAVDAGERPEPTRETTSEVEDSTKESTKTGFGTVMVTLRPWGYFWVDGERYTGKSEQEVAPSKRRRLSSGKHTVHLVDAERRRRDKVVEVFAGRETMVEVSLDRVKVTFGP